MPLSRLIAVSFCPQCAYVQCMLPLLLLIIAVIILAAPGWPSPPTLAAFVLSLLALLFLLTGWGSHIAWR